MTKIEFLEKLEKELRANVDMQTVRENVEYYDGYIRGEAANGRSESAVLDELGDPWVIARTIIDTQGTKGQEEYVYDAPQENYSRNASGPVKTHFWALDTWWKKLLLILGIVGIISIILSVVAGIVSLAAPILIPVLIVMMVVKLLKRK